MNSPKRDSARSGTTSAVATGGASVESGPLLGPPKPPVVEDLQAMIQRARSGDLEVLPQLRVLLETRPELWKHYGDLAIHAQHAWIDRVAGSDLFVKESLQREVLRLKQELAGPSRTPLEGLLIDRIVACWLQIHHADLAVAQAMGSSVKLVEFLGRRQARVHRSFLSSVGALAMVRRLAPTVGSADRGDRSGPEGHESAEIPEGAIGPDGRPRLRLLGLDERSICTS
jgi:hypothetical protein